METLLNLEFAVLDVISKITSPVLDKIMVFISSTGNAGLIWIVFGLILLCIKKYRKCGVTVLLSLIFCLVFGNIILKPLIARTRPFDIDKTIMLLIDAPKDFSFPSGHTFSSFAAASASVCTKNKYIYITAFFYAALIAFSRLYLKVHFPTDIIAGVVLGVLFGYISRKIVK